MEKFRNDSQIVIAVAEMARGNGEVGEMWLETAIFDRYSLIDDILHWAERVKCSGRLIVTIPDKEEVKDEMPR